MKITLQSRGGFAGGRIPPASFDTERLSADDAATLARLVAAAKAESAPHRTEGMRDTVTIEDGGQAVIVLSPSSNEATKFPAYNALLDWLEAHGRGGSGAGGGKT